MQRQHQSFFWGVPGTLTYFKKLQYIHDQPFVELMFTKDSRNETLQHLTSTSNAAKHVPRIAISLSSQNGLEWKKVSVIEVDTIHSNGIKLRQKVHLKICRANVGYFHAGSLDVMWTQHQVKG